MIHTVERRLLKLRGACCTCPLQESFVRVCTILAAACAQAVPRAGHSKDIRFAELTGACKLSPCHDAMRDTKMMRLRVDERPIIMT